MFKLYAQIVILLIHGNQSIGPEAVSPEGCIACGHCVAVCPREAIDNTKTPLSGQTGAVMVGYPKYTCARLVDRNPLEVTFIDQ